MDKSVFTDKNNIPGNDDLRSALGDTFRYWEDLRSFTMEHYPAGKEEWNYPGDKYGWSFRIRDKKRAILYLLPREGFFKVAFVFGQKATDQILASGISPEIKKELETARVYAEGRGIRIDVTNASVMNDVKMLINYKLAN